jgi:hypothetical protein
VKKVERVVEPREKQTVVMKIKNVSKQRLGVTLMVNGKSTLFDEEGDLARCHRWVIPPGKEYTIEGYYGEVKSYLPFKVLPDDMPDETMNSSQVGLIQLAVFEEGAEQEMKVSLRGLSRAGSRAKSARSFADLRRHVGATTGLEATPRGIIVPAKEPDKKPANLKRVKFDGVLVGSRTILYFDPKKDPEKPENKEKGKEGKDKKR